MSDLEVRLAELRRSAKRAQEANLATLQKQELGSTRNKFKRRAAEASLADSAITSGWTIEDNIAWQASKQRKREIAGNAAAQAYYKQLSRNSRHKNGTGEDRVDHIIEAVFAQEQKRSQRRDRSDADIAISRSNNRFNIRLARKNG